MTGSNESKIVTGRFWLADRPDNVVPGSLDLRDGRPQLHLLGALSPFMAETKSTAPGVKAFGPAPTPGPQTIHGVLLGSPGSVTLVNAYRIKITAAPLTVLSAEPNGGLQEERFEADYAVLGTHLAGMDAPFTNYRFRVRYQDEWACFSGLSLRLSMSENRFTGSSFDYTEPETVTAPLPAEAGTLQLQASATISDPTVWGARIRTTTWLAVNLAEPVTIRRAWQRYPVATGTLLTLLFAKESTPIAFEVRDPATSRWCPITTAGYEQDAEETGPTKRSEAPLFDRTTVSLEHVAEWLALSEQLSPLPHVLAGAITDSARTLPNVLLELITTAEGLHRRLHPDSRRLTEEQIRQAAEAMAASEIGSEALDILTSSLRTYLWDASLPQRLVQLADDAATAAPGVTGKTNKWKNAVTNARNGFAHSLETKGNGDDLYQQFALKQSLQWLLTARLLMALGLPDADIASAFTGHERYQRFLRQARRDLPSVYTA